MSVHTGQYAGTSSQEHHGATADGYSRQHNGNAYYYYASDLRIASLAHQQSDDRTPTGTAAENGAKLWRAARLGQLPRVQRLLKLGADVSYRCNEHGTTALHQAAENSHKDVVETLLEADASVDDMDHEGKIALHFATSADIVESLVMAGADVDHEDIEGKTPGRLALDRKNTAVVEALLNGRADPHKIYEDLKRTDSSRQRVSDNQSVEQGEDIDMQPDHTQGIHTSSDGYEQDIGDPIATVAAGLSDVNLDLASKNSDHSTSPSRDDQKTAHDAPPPHSRYDQILPKDLNSHVSTVRTPEVHSQLSAADSSPALSISESDQKLRLLIGIEFGQSIRIFYAVGHEERLAERYSSRDILTRLPNRKKPPERYILGDHLDPAWAMAQSDISSSFVRHLEDDDRLVQDETRRHILSNFVRALDFQISIEVASKGYANPASVLQKEVVMVVPTRWSESLEALAWKAARESTIGSVVVTAWEATVLYALCPEPAKPISTGNVYVVCSLTRHECSCEKRKVISIYPFRLVKLGRGLDCYKQISKVKGKSQMFDVFNWLTRKTAERARLDEERWVKDIREIVSRMVSGDDSDKGDINAIIIVENRWTPDRLAEIAQVELKQDFPEIEIIRLRPDDDEVKSRLLREAVVHHLRS